jgi:hypothetical protein
VEPLEVVSEAAFRLEPKQPEEAALLVVLCVFRLVGLWQPRVLWLEAN